MRVGLFIPCYVDQFFPRVAIATLELLEKLGCDIHYPTDQTCCGQPLANAGFESLTAPVESHFAQLFDDCDYIVAPSGSCVHHVRHHFQAPDRTESDDPAWNRVRELCEFMTDVIGVESLESAFPHRVGLHPSCHGLRGLRLGSSSELVNGSQDKVRSLLNLVRDIELVELERPDECCGFGGTFAVKEEIVSVAMGRDRLRDHMKGEAEFVTGTDMSCLMHLGGIIASENLPVQVIHVAEILNGKAS